MLRYVTYESAPLRLRASALSFYPFSPVNVTPRMK